MKIQSLAVIFIIIILPISLVLSSYMQNQIKTVNLQTSYDSKLKNATYDAVKAFQLNTANSSTSDIAASKIRDIEASANTFLNSAAVNFGLSGESKEAIKDYVPAIVYTMYDGYYIYSPFENTIPQEALGEGMMIAPESTYIDGQKIYGLKPYIYYSCRYKVGNDSDFTITYALDNYITIQGMINNKYVNESGYLIDNIKDVQGNEVDGYTSVRYRDIMINGENNLQEWVGNTLYTYTKINGVKYYKDESQGKWFSLLNGEKIYTSTDYDVDNDDINVINYNAANYYGSAYYFTDWVRKNTVLKNLKYSDAVDSEGKHFTITDKNSSSYTQNGGLVGNTTIFAKDTINNISIEEPTSNFNQHRLAVIRYAIESNLSVAIANYNNYTGTLTQFLMPSLAEHEWDLILNNISVISFLQGMSIGGKMYNGYAIVTNNKNGEAVTEDSIYITIGNDDDTGTYHRVGDSALLSANLGRAYFNIDFEAKTLEEKEETTSYYYPHKHLGSYTSIIAQTSVNDYDNIYKYLSEPGKENLAKVYYTALGRERYGMYKTSTNFGEDIEKYLKITANTSEWTNKNVTLTGKAQDGAGLVAYAWTTDEREPTTWTNIDSTKSEISYTTTLTCNGTRYFWTKNKLGQVECASYTVSKMDNTAPYLTYSPSYTPGSYYITVHIPASDNNTTSYFANSGIKTYGVAYYATRGAKYPTWVYSSRDTFNITGLSPSTLYYIKAIKIIDNAGNEKLVELDGALGVTTTAGYY